MTIIVKHRRTRNEYILLGIKVESKVNPSRMISEFFAGDKSQESCSATVCDAEGNMFLAYIDDLMVIEIDGKKPADILPEPAYEAQGDRSDLEPEDLEFEDDEPLTDESNDELSDKPATSFVYGQGSSAQRDVSDDDEDWI
jgi:hypothetical protein